MRTLILFTSIALALFMAGCASSNSNAEANVPVYNTGAPDSIVWVLIPAGDFYKTEHAHLTKMDYDYQIMRYDVTNAQYARYLNEALAKGTIKMKDNKNPLEQIREKKYYVKYQGKQNQQTNQQKNIYLVGVEFDENERNITNFEWEKVKVGLN